MRGLSVDGLRLLGPRTGVGRYVEYLLREWDASPAPFERIRLFTPRALDGGLAFGRGVEHRVVPGRFGDAYWEHVLLPRAHASGDLLFCPGYVVPALARGKVVVTHHGSYEAIPEAFPLWSRVKSRALYQWSARRADVVITVSASSRADIVRFYGIPESKIRVIPVGVDDAFRPLGATAAVDVARRRYFSDGRPFILFVGKLTQRRNVPQLVEAFARARSARSISHGLVLIGPNSAGHDLAALARRFGVVDSVVHRDYATHEELVPAYNAAELFIYPSSYEGFGLPVLEAMACGTPAIALRNSAFLEFADGAARLAPTGSADDLFRAIDEVLGSRDLREEMRRAGLERAAGYRWKPIAARTMDVLAEVARLR